MNTFKRVSGSMENWIEIKGYEDYMISSKGRVFSYNTKKFLKPQNNGYGYLFVILWKNGITKAHKIHRLVALAFIPNPENKRTVNHKDSDRTNNYVKNLEWATHSENSQHGYDNGLQKPPCLKGSKHGRAKLSEKEVLEIRRLHATGNYTQTALGKIFDVGKAVIGKIVNRKLWKHV